MLFSQQDRDLYPRSAGDGEWVFTNSTDYFKALVEDRTMDVTFDFFSAHGLETYAGLDGAKFTPEHNAWCITADISQSDRSSTPILFTRNLEIDALNASLAEALTKENPYGQHGAIVVRLGGAAQIVKAENLDPETFNPDGVANAVLRP